MKGFKDFLMRGNLVEIAVGLIMATSFGLVVKAFTDLLLAAIAKAAGVACHGATSIEGPIGTAASIHFQP